MSHAILSPSAAARWLACPPSARLEEEFPDTTSEAAAEGTLAHALGEALLRRSVAQKRSEKICQTKEIDRIKADKRYTPEMQNYMENYASFVVDQLNTARESTVDALLNIEVQLDISEYIPEGFGTGDAVIIADGTMEIIDLKYGQGVPVSAEDNPQMKLYALGALSEFDVLYGIDNVRMTIYQPRLNSISTWSISVSELKAWALSELIPRASMAFKGEGDFASGAHCRFCRAKALCKANASANMELAKYDFAKVDLLSDEDIADILSRADAFIKWIDSVQAYALHVATTEGKQYPGYKLVEGRSVRVFSDTESVEKILTDAGVERAMLYEQRMLTLSAIEKLIGKQKFNDLLENYVVKPQGKPTLVPLSDKRPALNSAEDAVHDFSNL